MRDVFDSLRCVLVQQQANFAQAVSHSRAVGDKYRSVQPVRRRISNLRGILVQEDPPIGCLVRRGRIVDVRHSDRDQQHGGDPGGALGDGAQAQPRRIARYGKVGGVVPVVTH